MENEKQYCTIYLVRHGETEWNIARRLQGHKNSNLTEKGKQQARELGEYLKNIHFDAAFSSDLGRARETAELITLSKKIAVQTTQSLRERSFGPQEGMLFEEANRKVQHLLDRFEKLTDEEKYRFKFAEDQESDEELARRLATYLREIAVAHPGKTVLAVSHGGIIRSFLVGMGYGTYKELSLGAVKNTACVTLKCDGIDFFVTAVKGIEKNPLT